MKLKYKSNNGFTLIELLVTIAIIGVLAAILLSTIFKLKESTRQVVCKNNLHEISLGLQMYYDDKKSFPQDGYPFDENDTVPLYSELEEYANSKGIFICPQDKVQTSISNFASYDAYYVARSDTYGEDEIVIGCPRHTGARKAMSLFNDGHVQTTTTGTVLSNGQKIEHDGTTDQRTISNVNDKLTFADGSEVTITQSSGGYGAFLVQSVTLGDGTLYSIVRVQKDGIIDVQVTSGSKFEIITPNAIVGVRGTRFTVETDNLGFTTNVNLVNGIVTVMNRKTGGKTVLAAGGTTSITVSENVVICHMPGTPFEQTMTIPPSALGGHFGHGDTMGACP